jgi:UDP-N-acetylglucosamine:LPS N-acetylglucosamine transferase
LSLSKPKILILTSLTGGGHLSLAQSLEDILAHTYEIHIVDPQSDFIRKYYTWAGRRASKSYGKGYDLTDSERAALLLHKFLTLFVQKRLNVLVEQIQPQLIITTHTLLSYAIDLVIRRRRANIPLVFQLSELEVVHETWLTVKNAAAYFVPTHEIMAQSQRRGIDDSRLYFTGLPVRKQFLQDHSANRGEMFTALNLEPTLFTVFLQGGAEGAAGIEQTVKSILASGTPMQILLAAGTNRPLAARFSGVERVRVIPFTRNIAPYMTAANVIIGKAGPNTIIETVMLEKPFVATAFIPGQEAPNLAFLERHNLGWVCLEREAQEALIVQLATDPSLIAEKMQSIQSYRTECLQARQLIPTVIDQLVVGETQMGLPHQRGIS